MLYVLKTSRKKALLLCSLVFFLLMLSAKAEAAFNVVDCSNPNHLVMIDLPEEQCTALENLWTETDGPSWTTNFGWDSLIDAGFWFGLSSFGSVSDILLPENNLTGNIPNLSGLPDLFFLDLSNNLLTGALPDFVSLQNLSSLRVNNNALAGTIPNFSNPNLYEIYLNNNQLTGPVPDFTALQFSLNDLDLSNNPITGSVPSFANLPSLFRLNLSNTELTGSVPNFVTLQGLNDLNLSNNQLSGSIPDFAALQNLGVLNLSSNLLTGTVPNFAALQFSLSELNLSNNQLTGNMPSFNGLNNLFDLNLSNNTLTGEVPTFPASDFSLVNLNLSNNQLSGIIPVFNNLVVIQNLNLSNNLLTGNIPDFTSSFLSLNLSDNQLTGSIPLFSSLDVVGSINDLNLSNNSLTGIIPNISVFSLKELNLSNNQFIGSIPAFSNSSLLKSIKLENNQLSGIIPDFTANNFSEIEALSFSDNNFVYSDFETQHSFYSSLGTYNFSPQAILDSDRSITIDENATLTITPEIALNPSDNDQYQWFLDGVAISTTEGTERIYSTTAKATDAGVYTYKVTNSVITGLTLDSHDTGEGISVTVIHIAQTINVDQPNAKTFGDASFDLIATGGGSANPIVFASTTSSVCSISGTTVSIIGAGTCTITANQEGDAIHDPAPQVSVDIVIAKADQTITNFTPPTNKTFGDIPFDLSATGGGSGNSILYASTSASVCSVSGNTVTILTGGICTITANQTGTANYNPATQLSADIVVAKVDQTISNFAPPASKIFGDDPFTLSASASSGLALSFTSTTPAICSVNGNMATILSVGTCTLIASQAGNDSYNEAPDVSANVVVSKADQTISDFTPPATKVFGDDIFDISATSSSGLAVLFASETPAVCSAVSGTVTILGAGLCTLSANQAGDDSYNAATELTADINVAKADQTISFDTIPAKTIDDDSFDLVATASSALNVSFVSTTPTVCLVTGATLSLEDSGSCSITASQAGDDNYNAATDVIQLVDIASAFILNIDGNENGAGAKPLTDGLLVLRYLFGFSGDALIANAVEDGAIRATAEDIQAYLQLGIDEGALDIDGDGAILPLTDGLLILRHLFGFTGDSLISNAISDSATRTTSEDIQLYLLTIMP